MTRLEKLLIAVILIGSAAGSWLYWTAHQPAEKVGKVVEATPAKEVAKAAQVSKPVKAVKVYSGGVTIKSKLNLPASVVSDANKDVIASSKLPASERSKTVTTVLDTETGASETYVRTDPRPWVAYESRGELGAYYGIKRGEPTVRIQARQDFVQVKALHIGAIGSVDRTMTTGATDYFVGVGLVYRW